MARKQTRRGTPKRRDPLSYEAIADAYRQELRVRPGGGPFSDYALVRLRRFFGGRRLAAITDEAVVEYALRREERDGATRETINSELGTLWKIQLFAVRRGLIKNEECCRIERLPVPGPAAALSPPDSHRRPGEVFGMPRPRWFKAAAGPGPAAGRSSTSTKPKQRRNYIPLGVLAELADQFRNSTPQGITDKLNDRIPGLNATRDAVGRQLKKLPRPQQ